MSPETTPAAALVAQNPNTPMRAYLRCPAEFKNILTEDLAAMQDACPSARIETLLEHGIIIKATPADIVHICYFCQAIEKAILVIGTAPIAQWTPEKNLPEIHAILCKPDLANLDALLPQEFTYRTEIIADKNTTRGAWRLEEAERLSEGWTGIISQINKSAEVNLRDPQFTIYAVLENDDAPVREANSAANSNAQAIIGIDLIGRDLSKRTYKITSTGVSVKGTIAYCVMRTSNPLPKALFLDPNCGTGEVAIEAGLYATHTSPWKYDKQFSWVRIPLFAPYGAEYLTKLDETYAKAAPMFRIRCVSPHFGHLAIARRHAKIAGVEHIIEFSRIEFKWLDAKFTKGEVDVVASCLAPPHSGISDFQKVKEAKLLFYQLEFLLKNQGKTILMTHAPSAYEQAATAFGFRKLAERSVQTGALQVFLQSFEKTTRKSQPEQSPIETLTEKEP